MTQHQKIIKLCSDGQWHCQNSFRALYIFSPHKRRIEIEGRKNELERAAGKYIFETRPCEHGYRGQKDYRMRLNTERLTSFEQALAQHKQKLAEERRFIKLF